MPRSRGDKDYLVPVKGFNTEASPLNFPEDSAVDLLNVQLDYDPLRIRVRKGLEKEAGGVGGTTSVTNYSTDKPAVSVFRWENVNNNPDTTFIVGQAGSRVYFWDATASDVSANQKGFAFDLDNAKSGTAEGTSALVTQTPVNFVNVKGRLLIVGRAIEPVLVSYDSGGDTISTIFLDIKIRDVMGIDDGLGVDERPSVLSEEHEYNLYNQGWHQQRRKTSGGGYIDPVAEFNTVNSEYPSNADVVWVGMVESSGDLIFDAEWLKDQTFGSSPAPRGHYIVDAFDIARETLRATPTTVTGVWGGSSGSGGLGGASGTTITTEVP